MATRLPIIDLPQTTTTQRAVARGQAAVDDLQTAQRSAQVSRQQPIDTDGTRLQSIISKNISVVSQPLKFVQTPTQVVIGSTTGESANPKQITTIVTSPTDTVVVPNQVTTITTAVNVATATSTTVVTSDPAIRVQPVSVIPVTTATTNKVVNTRGGNTANTANTSNNATTVINQRYTQNYQVNNPGGADGEVQFYANGKFSADSDFKYYSSTDTLQLNGWLKTGNLQVGEIANLGQANNLIILGGTNGDILRTDGKGNLSWTSIAVASSSNNINDGTSLISIETNSNVNFTVGGNSNVMIVTDRGAVANVFTSNNFVLGNATTTISTTRWLDAMTATVNPTVLFTTANTISSVDVHITADDGNSKQITKMLSVTKGETTTYSQYGNVTIGTEMASFYMDQSNGLVRVITRPSSSDRVDYRLVVTLYN
jgi:hypothetical protein